MDGTQKWRWNRPRRFHYKCNQTINSKPHLRFTQIHHSLAFLLLSYLVGYQGQICVRAACPLEAPCRGTSPVSLMRTAMRTPWVRGFTGGTPVPHAGLRTGGGGWQGAPLKLKTEGTFGSTCHGTLAPWPTLMHSPRPRYTCVWGVGQERPQSARSTEGGAASPASSAVWYPQRVSVFQF